VLSLPPWALGGSRAQAPPETELSCRLRFLGPRLGLGLNCLAGSACSFVRGEWPRVKPVEARLDGASQSVRSQAEPGTENKAGSAGASPSTVLRAHFPFTS